MREVLQTRNLICRVMQGHCPTIARFMKQLFGHRMSARWVQRQMEEDELQENFYGKFLKWLYSIEASTFIGSRLIIAALNSRFPLLSESDRRKLSLTEFLDHLIKLLPELIALVVTNEKGQLKVKVLEGQLLFTRAAESL